MRRINVTLDDEHAAKLAALAERTHVNEGTVARSLLSGALDESDPDPRHIGDLLDAIPGFADRLSLARAQGRRGDVVPLSDL